jgi:hypothetical protein
MRIRLGAGDISASGPNPAAQICFLEAVALCVPQALDDLASRDATDASQLQAWARHWGFADDWLRRHARTHVRLWRDHPDLRGRWSIFTPSVRWEPILPAAPSWNLTKGEPEAEYHRRHKAYIATLKRTPGLAATPEKRDSGVHFEWLALHHVGRWTYKRLAERYQNTEGNPNESAISRAVTETAALVGLTLRPARARKLTQLRRS